MRGLFPMVAIAGLSLVILACGGGATPPDAPSAATPSGGPALQPAATAEAPAIEPSASTAAVASPSLPPCVSACRTRRQAEATEGEVIDAECGAACGHGDRIVRLQAEPGLAVVRGKLDAADEPAPEGLPLPITFGLHVDGGVVGLSCEPDGWGDLVGREVWLRGYLLEDRPDFEPGMRYLRDCQGLAVVDAP